MLLDSLLFWHASKAFVAALPLQMFPIIRRGTTSPGRAQTENIRPMLLDCSCDIMSCTCTTTQALQAEAALCLLRMGADINVGPDVQCMASA